MSLPVIAIVGAPNVGKSTLFNRMLGRRKAIVSDQPGVTRDRLMAEGDLFGVPVMLVDTGGVVEGSADDLTQRVRDEALKAVEAADVILMVVDARAGVSALDLEVARLLRPSGKTIIPVANKIDASTLEGLESETWRLGLGEAVPISAEQGRGIDELIDRLKRSLPADTGEKERPGVPVAIVGRPNVGKSSLFNRIVRDVRSLVTPIPGTTRDPVDALFEHQGVAYRVVDTAGIRRRAGRGEEVEWVSVLKARQALKEASLAIALVDASEEIGHQDRALLGLVAEHRIPAVVAANKIDLIAPRGTPAKEAIESIRRALGFASYVPIRPISALTGDGIEGLLDTLDAVRAESLRRFATAELNRVLQEILAEKQPPSDGGRDVRFYYMTQVGGSPPRFLVFGNGRKVAEPYRRFLTGRLRTHLGLELSPVAVSFRRRSVR